MRGGFDGGRALVIRLLFWSVFGVFFGWLVGWLVGGLVGWLVGWLALVGFDSEELCNCFIEVFDRKTTPKTL